MKIMLLSLRTLKDGKSQLSFDFTNGLTDFSNHQSDILDITLPNGNIKLNKWSYLNTGKIYDDGKQFFLVANKQMNQDYAFNLLLEYAMSKVDTRINHLQMLKQKYKSELKKYKSQSIAA